MSCGTKILSFTHVRGDSRRVVATLQMNIVHVIGNGFDLNHGLPTSYAHFYEFYFQLRPQKGDTEAVVKLREKLREKLYDEQTDRWADLEKTLGEVTTEFETDSEFEEAYLDIYRHLLEYLKAVYDNSEVLKYEKFEETIYRDLAMPWKHLVQRERIELEGNLPVEDSHVSIINFNYTDTLARLCDLSKSVGKNMGRYDNRSTIYDGCQHVHHRLESNDIILGVDNSTQILNERFRGDEMVQNYLIKPQTNTGMGNMVDTYCLELIRKARVISIYGMSIGETDSTWWKEIGNRLIKDNNVRVLYFPFVSDIANVLPIQQTLLRNQQISKLCKFFGVKSNDVKGRVLVNFCNLPGKRNIFTNTTRKDVAENFEHTMALFQERNVIYKPQAKPISTRLSLEEISPIEPNKLFEPRVYRKKLPAFMNEKSVNGLTPITNL